ncbi:MAG: class I SAM-dependent methyltransferase [Betaproteobacteria bacterium]
MSAAPERWQLTGSAPEYYERNRVPAFHGPVAKIMLDRMALRPGQAVLDLACGTGIAARLAAPRVQPGGRVTGLDLNEEMLAVARVRARSASLYIDWRRGDACALPFAEGVFDAIVCQQGLQFFVDPLRALREVRRVAASGAGMAVSVSVPGVYNIALAEALAQYAGETVAASSFAPFALGEQTTLIKLVEQAQLTGITTESVTLMRRIEPTQQWLLEESRAMPYGNAVAALEPAARTALLRYVSSRLQAFWRDDAFLVPREALILYAKKA